MLRLQSQFLLAVYTGNNVWSEKQGRIQEGVGQVSSGVFIMRLSGLYESQVS